MRLCYNQQTAGQQQNQQDRPDQGQEAPCNVQQRLLPVQDAADAQVDDDGG